MSSQLIQIIEKCLSPNNSLRQSGEKDLFNYANLNYYQTLVDFCALITNNQSTALVRQFCGTFLKFLFTNDPFISEWNNLSKEQKEVIKNNLMGSLASELQDTRNTCSLAIAALAKIEMEKGWKVIDVLFSASHHENINYRITSIITFKNMIDLIGHGLKQDQLNNILGALTDNMDLKLKQDVIYQANLGFNNIINFIENNIKNEKQRNYIIDTLVNLLEPNYISQVNLGENIQKIILINLIEIMRQYSQYMENSFSRIAEMTFRMFHGINKELAALAMELWCTLCDYEINIKNNIITSKYQDSLTQSIIRILQERDINSLKDEEEWNYIKTTVILISELVMLPNKKVCDGMLKYISECLNNDLVVKYDNNLQTLTKDEIIKALFITQNAFLAYRGLLYAKYLDSDIIISSLKKIISELNDNKYFPIGDNISYCLIIICKAHNKIYKDNKDNFQILIEQILKLLDMHIEHEEIELNLLISLKHIFKNAEPKYFSKYLTDIINILMKIAYSKNNKDKNFDLIKYPMFLTGLIIETSENTEENHEIIQLFFSKLYTLFEESLNMANFPDQMIQQFYQDYIISIIASCCGEYQKITMNGTQIKYVFNLIEQVIIQRKCIFPEALFTFGSFAYFGWEVFSNINDQVMNYILISLEDKKNIPLIYQGLIAADDIIRCLGNENITLIPKIVEKMQKIIKDPELPRGLKIKCFPLYNDIFMTYDNSVGVYLSEALDLLANGMTSSLEPLTKETDKDTIEYVNEFREKIVELLTGVFSFLTEQNQTNIFSNYIDGFVRYLSKIVEPENNPELSLIAEVGGILGDLYHHFKSTVDLYLNKKSLDYILQRLEKSDLQEHKDVLKFMKNIFFDSNYDY